MNGRQITGHTVERPPGLAVVLRQADMVLLVVGNTIGSGIFLTAATVSEKLGHHSGWIVTAWIIGGLFALAGALTYAELGAAFPRAGGHYAYIRETYGDWAAFFDGWISIFAAFPCGVAFMAMGFAGYLITALPAINKISVTNGWFTPQQIVAVVSVIVLTAINCVGLMTGKRTQNMLTLLKISGMAVIILAGFLYVSPEPTPWKMNSLLLPPVAGLSAIAGALLGISFAYLGWDAATYVAAESIAPRRDLPRALLYGTAIVLTIYLLFNLALYRIDPSCDPLKALTTLFGSIAGSLIATVIMLCILGAMNATIIVGPRVGFAMAQDGLFFKQIAMINPRFHAPTRAIIMQGIWTVTIILTGTFGQILTGAVVAMLTLSIVTAAAVFVLRIRRPELSRPYKVWGYPVVPMVYCLGTSAILINTLAGDKWMLMKSFLVLLAGVPVFLVSRRMRTS